MSSFVFEVVVDGETFMREVYAEDVLPLADVKDLNERAALLWRASWPHPPSGGAVSDAELDVNDEGGWTDLFNTAKYALEDF